MGESLLDMNVVAELRDVMGEQFGFLCERYIADAGQRLEAMAAAVAAKDVDTLRAQAHSLKGASANLGALGLADMCLAMEQLAKTGSWEAAEGQLQELQREGASVMAKLPQLAG